MECLKSFSEKIPARHVLCFMFFLGFMVTFLLRVNINLAIVAMVNTTNFVDEVNTPDINECVSTQEKGNDSFKVETSKEENVLGEFEWNEVQQGIILSSFFWGYLLFQIPGGRISEVWGPKVVFGTNVLMNGLLSLLLPFLARWHWTLLLLVRALQGLGQGVIFPCINAAVPRWVPIEERSRFISFAIQGCSLGQVVALPLCGWILTKMGWPAVFYISGILGLLWYFAWHLLVFDSPDVHPRISLKEKQYLENRIEKIKTVNVFPVPWLTILTSFQFWVGAVAAIGSDWGFHTFCNFGPKYFKTSLGFDLEQSSWLSSLPFLSQYVFSLGFSVFCDWLLKIKVSLIMVRKFSVVVSHLIPALGLILLIYVGCNITYSVIILTFCVSMLGAMSSGFFQNPLDIAPNFAGSMTGMINSLGALTAVISTPLSGSILQTHETKTGWQYIFFITAAVYISSSLPYLIWAKVTVEPWNDLGRYQKGKMLKLKDFKGKNEVPELTALTTS